MRNVHLQKLKPSYLFQEIAKRTAGRQGLINLGIGDATAPIPPSVANEMAAYAATGPTGYGPSEGLPELREKIAATLPGIAADEVFISDGAKSDLARLQFLFDPKATVAIQDPSYPVYVDVSILGGHPIVLMPCTPDNDFFPDLPEAEIFYYCSPNNPTGAAATRQQLQRLVAHAQQLDALIIFDAAYSAFIQDPDLPRSIFEIEGAREVAIEVNSFSKFASFTGIRLGWTVVPKGRFYRDWVRLTNTLFNGASNIAQIGGLAALDAPLPPYMENARHLKEVVHAYGGENAPYLWMPVDDSWKAFEHLLDLGLITTPGVGFGPSGEGFIRLSAFGTQIEEAVQRLALYADTPTPLTR